MTVEHIAECPIHGEGGVSKLEFCEAHASVLSAMAHQRQMNGAQCDQVVNTMTVGVLTFMGPDVFVQHGNCPVCVLEGTLERACDEISMLRRKAN